ncbi:MAG: alpha/beta fold hydrolase [Syntrophomonadaceae bacterium]|nr:alpha/beta fold hydrolase [Syntrophomonadaceae bacterium]
MFDFFTRPPFFEFFNSATNDLIQNLSRSTFLGACVEYKNSSRFWDKIESRRVAGCSAAAELFCNESQHRDLDIIAAFGSATPDSDQYLLHFAPGWNSNRQTVPVLLVPGAGLDATSFNDLYAMEYTGLQQQLTSLGYRVFVLTFSHLHGDNYIQAEQLAAAIERVKEVSGHTKIDIIAHSKGGMAARLYLSNMAGTGYRDDVRRYVMLGTPNLGLDYSFRTPLFNYAIFTSGSSGVMAWDRVMAFGSLIDVTERSIYEGGAFPGQSQMLHRWDDEYQLEKMQPDWWTTYYGGLGLISHSYGIEEAMAYGGNLIDQMNQAKLEDGIEFSVLAGDKSTFHGMPGDETGPGDGIVFVDSALYTDGLAGRGARLKEKTVLSVNHMELLYSRRVARWVDSQLTT